MLVHHDISASPGSVKIYTWRCKDIVCEVSFSYETYKFRHLLSKIIVAFERNML
jgi:hypothetical protein